MIALRLVLVLLGLLVASTEACKCFEPMLNTSLADNDIAARVAVQREIDTGDEYNRYFVASKIRAFKGCGLDRKMVVKTSSSSAACGVNLNPNSQYLLFGSTSTEVIKGFWNDRKVLVLNINSCQYQRKWRDLPQRERRELQRLSPNCKKTCQPQECPVRILGGPQCPDGETIEGPFGDCIYYKESNSCQWEYISCPTCNADADCKEEQYCAGGQCRKDGTCRSDRDCFNPSNDYTIYKKCVYYKACTDYGQCDGICGSSCPDGLPLVNCFKAPCEEPNGCDEEYASCQDDYCGGCNSLFFDAKGDPAC